ncbi:MFS sugar transporter-like protein [Geopyxis carbonaria]|nr:MFS sugar transporter-like protein [Geopyxis carbonaria]
MGKLFTFSLAIFAAFGSFLFGYDSGVMTDVIASEHFLAYFNTSSGSPVLGAIVSTFAGGAFFGALSGGLTMDKLGRRKTIQIGAVVCIVGAVLQAASVHLGMMLVGRIITGWAVGIMSMAVPVYQAELAHPKTRGLIVGLAQQMIGVGFIVSTWVGYGAAHAPGWTSFPWRFPLAFQGVPACVLAVGLIWFPESPRQLIEKDNEEEAMRVLQKLHFDGSNDAWIQSEFTEIRRTILAEKAIHVPGWAIMFQVPSWRKRLALGTLVQVFTQFTGINVINYYQTSMYAALGITGKKALLVSGIYNVVGPVANCFFIFLLADRVGRKKPLLFGTVAITVCLFIEAAINSQNPDGTDKALSKAGVAMLFLVSIFFSFSFGPVSWTYMSEIMPMQIRGKGNAFAAGVGNWLFNVFWSQVSPQALEKLGWKFYFIFAVFNICITFPTIWFFFKETKGLSLEEIDGLFGDSASERSLPKEVETLHEMNLEKE